MKVRLGAVMVEVPSSPHFLQSMGPFHTRGSWIGQWAGRGLRPRQKGNPVPAVASIRCPHEQKIKDGPRLLTRKWHPRTRRVESILAWPPTRRPLHDGLLAPIQAGTRHALPVGTAQLVQVFRTGLVWRETHLSNSTANWSARSVLVAPRGLGARAAYTGEFASPVLGGVAAAASVDPAGTARAPDARVVHGVVAGAQVRADARC